MKKLLCLLLAAVLSIGLLSGCTAPPVEDGRLSVVTTIFPEYDWAAALTAGSDATRLHLLMDKGVDPHSFQPSARDLVTVAGCDLFIYVGGESDAWVEDALREAVNPDMIVIRLLDVIGQSALQETAIPGMEGETEPDELDEHIWLSLRNAERCCQAITQALTQLDPEHAALYRQNQKSYCASLTALDQDYQTTVAQAPCHTLLFGDRFPFRYLTEDYDLEVYAAFPGCSSETDASFSTIAYLARQVARLSLPAVLILDAGDPRIAETIVENAGKPQTKILSLNSMQTVSAQDIQNGASYLSIMQENLLVLRQALGL